MTPDIETLERQLDVAHYGGASTDTVVSIQREIAQARQATESTDGRCFRLGLMAAAKDAEAERHFAAEADAAGRAAGRRLRGNDDEYARSFDREAVACRKLGLEAQSEAERLRSQAAALRRAQSFASDVLDLMKESV